MQEATSLSVRGKGSSDGYSEVCEIRLSFRVEHVSDIEVQP